MKEIKEEGRIPGAEEPKPIDETELKEKKLCYCKIVGKEVGTGFFSKIEYKGEEIPVLITNYHVIDDQFMKERNFIKYYIDNDYQIIDINENSRIYSSDNNKYDIMIIKLDKDRKDNYLYIDKNIFKSNSESAYKDEQIYILHYPNGEKAKVSYSGKGLENINKYEIKHFCNTDTCSSGSPILTRMTHQVIGIHKAYNQRKMYNIGTFLKFPLNELKEEEKNIDIFEHHILNENPNYPDHYILSPNFSKFDPEGIYSSKISIFDINRGTVEKDKGIIEKVLKTLMTNKPPREKEILLKEFNLTEKEKRSIGSMLGMAIGDAMGARYASMPVRYGVVDLKDIGYSQIPYYDLNPGQWTDNTSMGLCLADSLLMNGGELDQHDLMRRFLCWWKSGYNNTFRFNEKPRKSIGLDRDISLSFDYYLENPKPETRAGDRNTSGNGSITRNAAVPICFNYNIDKACEIAKKQSLVTHQGLEARECCSLLTHIIVRIINGKNLKDELNNLYKSFQTNVKSVEYLAKSEMEGNDINRNWDWKKLKQYFYSPERSVTNPKIIGSYVMDSMAMSLNILYSTTSFRDALIKIVNIRGDSNSVASVVGQIAGAYYPIVEIPEEWIRAIYYWDKGEIALRGYMLARLKEGKSYIK